MCHYILQINGILANGTIHELIVNITHQDVKYHYENKVNGLFPATNYTLTLFGCTTPGCGVPGVIYQKTKEMG